MNKLVDFCLYEKAEGCEGGVGGRYLSWNMVDRFLSRALEKALGGIVGQLVKSQKIGRLDAVALQELTS